MNIKTIYVHIDANTLPFLNELEHSDYVFSSLPEYAKYSFDSIRKYTATEPILINDISLYNDKLTNFFNMCKQGFPAFYKDKFWLLTLLRLYIVYLYVIENKIDKFVHLEYDNLIYHNYDVFNNLPNGIYFNKVGPELGSAGIIYCNSINHFIKFFEKIEQLLIKGHLYVSKFTNYPTIGEMVMIDLIHKHTTDIISYFPLLPIDKFYNFTNMVFDGASYGQYISGTPFHPSGFYDLRHYVGQLLHHKKISIILEDKPYLYFNNEKYKIFNLHIHSKKLKEYIK
jgi:hypothetical protein